ncbi:MAG: TSUP family transporter [Thermodesulfobacteriota bacterium]
MEYVVICSVAIVVSALTLFSGFGLGTLLMPAFAVFFPIGFAVAATAVVHLANNLFKVFLVGKHADIKVVIRFALPAALSAALGAYLLGYISDMAPIAQYTVGSRACEVTMVKLMIAVLIGFFALWDLLPRFQQIAFDARYIALGGALSGFFGGLSGLQGALRSAFLIRCGLGKEAFVATGVVSTVVVDISRLVIYGATFAAKDPAFAAGQGATGLIVAGMMAAFLGSFIGVRLLRKTTMKEVQGIVGAMLFILAIGLAAGLF